MVKVIGRNVHLDVPLTSEILIYGPPKEEAQEYDVGVFSKHVFF